MEKKVRTLQVHPKTSSTEEDFVRRNLWTSDVVSYELSTEMVLTVTTKTPIPSTGFNSPNKLMWFSGGPGGVWRIVNANEYKITCAALRSTLFDWEVVHLKEDENMTLQPRQIDSKQITCGFLPPAIAYCRTTIFNVFEIDTVSQTFHADVFFELRFRFIALPHTPIEWVHEYLDVLGIRPQVIECLNNVSIDGEDQFWTTFLQSPLAPLLDFCYKKRFKGCFSEQFELQVFPFDQQALTLSLTVNQPIFNIMLRTNDHYPSLFMQNQFASENVFTVVTAEHVLNQVGVSDPSESSTGHLYPCVDFQIILQRKPGYHISNVFVPVSILTYLGFLSFGIVSTRIRMETADRLSTSITLLLTTVAYKFAISGSLPQIPYLTSLDRFVTFSNLVMVSFAIENATFPWICTDSESCFDTEQLVMWLMFGAFTVGILYGSISIYHMQKQRVGENAILMEQHQLRLFVAKQIPNELPKQRWKIYLKLLQDMNLPSVEIVRPRICKVATSVLSHEREEEAIRHLKSISEIL